MTSLRSRAPHRRTAMLLSLVLALGVLGLSTPTASAAATPTSLANAALARATTELKANHPTRAIAALKDLRYQMGRAHTAAMRLIGAPPTDPESDEPPGPPAVLGVLALEHRVVTTLLPRFNGATRSDVVWALRLGMTSAQSLRVTMLSRVIALPADGARGDYEDGMADTLGQYTTEVNQLSTAVKTYRLTSSGKTGLQNALTRARATKTMVNAAFGGGE